MALCNSYSSYKSGGFTVRLLFPVQNIDRRVGGTGEKIARLHCHYPYIRFFSRASSLRFIAQSLSYRWHYSYNSFYFL